MEQNLEFREFPKIARLSREVIISEKIDGTNAQILITEDGQILTNVPFFITDQEGKNYQGITDEKGSCGRIKTNNKQTLDVLLGVMALEKWNGS